MFDAAAGIDLPPQRRGAGLVLQGNALFPHLTVRRNIAFGLHGRPRAEQEARVDELLRLLAIEHLADRLPSQVSGGQAQRAALARALAPRPRLLLLDEPFSALDTAVRLGLRRELLRLARDLDLTVIFVTHDLREAYNLADRIAVFDEGRTLQVGSRDDVFNRPASARVARLTEVRNVWPGVVVEQDTAAGTLTVDTGRFRVRAAGTLAAGAAVSICIRPERVILLRPERHAGEDVRDTALAAVIVDEVAHGASHTLYLRVDGDGRAAAAGMPDIEVDLPSHPYEVMGVGRQRHWTLVLPRAALHVMPAG